MIIIINNKDIIIVNDEPSFNELIQLIEFITKILKK